MCHGGERKIDLVLIFSMFKNFQWLKASKMSIMQRVAASMNRGHPSSYYDKADAKSNPVFVAYDQELERFVAALKKRKCHGHKPNAKEPYCKL